MWNGGIMEEKEYTTTKVAKMLGVDRKTVINWIKKGYIKARIVPKLKKNMYYIPESEVLRLQRIFKEKEKQLLR